jgi:hypothetical protein
MTSRNFVFSDRINKSHASLLPLISISDADTLGAGGLLLFENTFFLGQEHERLALILLCNRADLGNHQVSSTYDFLYLEYPYIWPRRDLKILNSVGSDDSFT